MGSEERERALNALKLALSARNEVELAVVHGGFVSSEVFRDVDVALYTGHRVSADETPSYVDEVREELERVIGIGVDVQLLDYARLRFAYGALAPGQDPRREEAEHKFHIDGLRQRGHEEAQEGLKAAPREVPLSTPLGYISFGRRQWTR